MRPTRTAGSLLAILCLFGVAAAEAEKAKEKPKTAAEPKAGDAKAGKPAPLAQVGDVTITDADVQKLVGDSISRMWAEFEQKIQQAREQNATREADMRSAGLEELVARSLVDREAKARGVTVEELIKTEVDGKINMTDDEIRTIYDVQKNQQPLVGRSEEEGLKMVEDRLRQKKASDRRVAYVRELRSKGGVRMLTEPKRVDVSLDDDPIRGATDAPITIVEFSDFQCPYCAKVEPTLRQLSERYGNKIRWGYRDYPLNFHPFAGKAAEAGTCAADQGKFWELHAKIFASQSKLTVDDLKGYAVSVGLDKPAFDECLDSGRHAEEWKKDLAEGTRYGVTGTPAFFINGRFLNGAAALDKFTSIIDDELERKGIPTTPKSAAAGAPAEDR